MKPEDKEAYRKACWEWATNSGGKDLGKYMFKAALAHRDAQPAATFCEHQYHYFGDQKVRRCNKCCALEPAVAVNERLLTLLKEYVNADRDLTGIPCRKTEAIAVIKAAEAAKGGV